jgi:hypothetical protein
MSHRPEAAQPTYGQAPGTPSVAGTVAATVAATVAGRADDGGRGHAGPLPSLLVPVRQLL